MRLITLLTVMMLATFAAAQPGPATAPTTRPATPHVNPGAPDQLLNSMLKPPTVGGAAGNSVLYPLPDAPKISGSTGKAIAPNPPPINLLREGSFVSDRAGRLTKNADGQWEFTFDADGKTMEDPPLGILPNLKLMAMENAVSGSSADLRFRITGMVTEYKGKNFILLEKVLVVPGVTQQF